MAPDSLRTVGVVIMVIVIAPLRRQYRHGMGLPASRLDLQPQPSASRPTMFHRVLDQLRLPGQVEFAADVLAV